MKEEIIIDVKEGRITKRDKENVVYLKGEKLSEDSSYIDDISIVIKDDEEGERKYPLKIGGYDFKLFLGNFSDEFIEDILIYGETDGSGGYVIASVYRYNNGKLTEIFNADTLSDRLKFKCRYLKEYKVEVICEKLQKKYILDISTVDKNYLADIYNEDGKIITDTDPTISYINKIYPIMDFSTKLLRLESYQRIIGSINASNLGIVQNIISLKDGNNNIITQNVVNNGVVISELSKVNKEKDEIISKLPEGSIPINFNKFGGRNGLIRHDIDNDGQDEIICGYKYKDIQYLTLFKSTNGILKLLDTIEGAGYDISDLIITRLNQRGGENIIVGWKIGSIWSVLDIVEVKEDKLVKTIKGDRINYSKIDICDSNNRYGNKDIALWIHETGEAYKIQIYTLRGDGLEKTSRNDKEYFAKVEEYYKNLINKSRETPQYLYYLIDAQCRLGKKREAIENINKALKHSEPFPSIQELKRLKRNL